MPKASSTKKQQQQSQSVKRSKELYRQKECVFSRLKQLHKQCGVVAVCVLITERGVIHCHGSPELKHLAKDCVKPLSGFVLERRKLCKEQKKRQQPAAPSLDGYSSSSSSSSSSEWERSKDPSPLL